MQIIIRPRANTIVKNEFHIMDVVKHDVRVERCIICSQVDGAQDTAGDSAGHLQDTWNLVNNGAQDIAGHSAGHLQE